MCDPEDCLVCCCLGNTACFLILSFSCVFIGALRTVLILTWGQNSINANVPQTLDEYKASFYMEQRAEYADCAAKVSYETEYLPAFDPGTSLGLLWLDIASQLLLIFVGLLAFLSFLLCGKGSLSDCCSGAFDFNSVMRFLYPLLVIISLIMEVIVFIIDYPGRLLNPDTAFGLFSVVGLVPKYFYLLMVGYFLYWYEYGRESGNGSGPGSHQSLPTEDELIHILPAADSRKYRGDLTFAGIRTTMQVTKIDSSQDKLNQLTINNTSSNVQNLSQHHTNLVNQVVTSAPAVSHLTTTTGSEKSYDVNCFENIAAHAYGTKLYREDRRVELSKHNSTENLSHYYDKKSKIVGTTVERKRASTDNNNNFIRLSIPSSSFSLESEVKKKPLQVGVIAHLEAEQRNKNLQKNYQQTTVSHQTKKTSMQYSKKQYSYHSVQQSLSQSPPPRPMIHPVRFSENNQIIMPSGGESVGKGSDSVYV